MTDSGRRVFISYRRMDVAMAEAIYNKLKKAGFDPWLDLKKIPKGSNWNEAITDGIQRCDAFVLLVSPWISDSYTIKEKEWKGILERQKEPNPPPILLLYVQTLIAQHDNAALFGKLPTKNLTLIDVRARPTKAENMVLRWLRGEHVKTSPPEMLRHPSRLAVREKVPPAVRFAILWRLLNAAGWLILIAYVYADLIPLVMDVETASNRVNRDLIWYVWVGVGTSAFLPLILALMESRNAWRFFKRQSGGKGSMEPRLQWALMTAFIATGTILVMAFIDTMAASIGSISAAFQDGADQLLAILDPALDSIEVYAFGTVALSISFLGLLLIETLSPTIRRWRPFYTLAQLSEGGKSSHAQAPLPIPSELSGLIAPFRYDQGKAITDLWWLYAPEDRPFVHALQAKLKAEVPQLTFHHPDEERPQATGDYPLVIPIITSWLVYRHPEAYAVIARASQAQTNPLAKPSVPLLPIMLDHDCKIPDKLQELDFIFGTAKQYQELVPTLRPLLRGGEPDQERKPLPPDRASTSDTPLPPKLKSAMLFAWATPPVVAFVYLFLALFPSVIQYIPLERSLVVRLAAAAFLSMLYYLSMMQFTLRRVSFVVPLLLLFATAYLCIDNLSVIGENIEAFTESPSLIGFGSTEPETLLLLLLFAFAGYSFVQNEELRAWSLSWWAMTRRRYLHAKGQPRLSLKRLRPSLPFADIYLVALIGIPLMFSITLPIWAAYGQVQDAPTTTTLRAGQQELLRLEGHARHTWTLDIAPGDNYMLRVDILNEIIFPYAAILSTEDSERVLVDAFETLYLNEVGSLEKRDLSEFVQDCTPRRVVVENPLNTEMIYSIELVVSSQSDAFVGLRISDQGILSEPSEGLGVVEVLPNSPATKAGFFEGSWYDGDFDIIIMEVNGQPVGEAYDYDADDFYEALEPGQALNLGLYLYNDYTNLSLVPDDLRERCQSAATNNRSKPNAD